MPHDRAIWPPLIVVKQTLVFKKPIENFPSAIMLPQDDEKSLKRLGWWAAARQLLRAPHGAPHRLKGLARFGTRVANSGEHRRIEWNVQDTDKARSLEKAKSYQRPKIRFPSLRRGFDSFHPLQSNQRLMDESSTRRAFWHDLALPAAMSRRCSAGTRRARPRQTHRREDLI
jgi:hypothetical protein